MSQSKISSLNLYIYISFIVVMVFYKSLYKVQFLDWILGLSVVVLSIMMVAHRQRISKAFLFTSLLALSWIPIAFITVTTIDFQGNHLSGVLLYFILCIISLGFVQPIFQNKNSSGKIFLILLILWLLVTYGFIAMYSLGKIEYENGNYFSGIYENRNDFAMQTVIITSLTYYFSNNTALKKILLFLSFVVILITQSLTALMMFLVMMYLNKFLAYKLVGKLSIFVFILLIGLLLYFFIPSFTLKLDQIFLVIINPNEIQDGYSIYYRLWLLINGFNIWLENFWFGIGINNSIFYLIPDTNLFADRETGFYSHNNYIELALNYGVFGLLVHYLPIIYILFNLKNHYYKQSIIVYSTIYLLSSFSAVTYNIFGFVFFYTVILYLFFKGKYEENNNYY